MSARTAGAAPARQSMMGPPGAALDAPVSPFDAAAADYDRTFTATALGACLRRAVWRRLDARFAAGDRVLELGCGTGEDALHLARRGVRVTAIDASPAMVAVARGKLAAAPAGDGGAGMAPAEVHLLTIEDLAGLPAGAAFDGAFANFGGLNCVADLAAVAAALAERLRPGAPVLLCVMGPLAPWEWLWLLRAGRPREVLRRLRRGGIPWRGATIRYPSIRRLRRAFAADFQPLRVSAVGALLPPTRFAPWAARHPRLLAGLDRLERRLERVPLLPWLADHYLMELVRTSGPSRAGWASRTSRAPTSRPAADGQLPGTGR